MVNPILNKKLFYVILQTILKGLSFGVLVVLFLLSNANPFFYTPNRDSGFFMYAGRIMLNGGILYRDVWDSKPPAIFYINALGLWLGHDTAWGIWLLEVFFLFTSLCIGYILIKKLWGAGAAIVGTLFWTIPASYLMITGNLIEEYPLLFSFLALYCFYRMFQNPRNWIYPFLIGITGAINFLFRANIIGVQLAIVLLCFIDAIHHLQFIILFKRMIMFLAGVILPLVLTGFYFYSLGTLKPMLDAAIFYNFSYAGGRANLFITLGNAFSYLGIIAWISLAIYILVLINALWQWKQKTILPLTLLMVLLWPIEIGLTSLSGRGYDHYFISWMPALALMAGYACFLILSQKGMEKVLAWVNCGEVIILLGITLVCLILNQNTFIEYRFVFHQMMTNHKNNYEKTTPITDYIQKHTHPGDTVLAWGGQAGINYLARRNAPTAYIWYPLYLDSPFTSALNDDFYKDLQSNKPVLIIDAYQNAPGDVLSIAPSIRQKQLTSGDPWLHLTGQTTNLQDVYQLINSTYHLETNVDGYDIYRLNGSQ